MMFSFFAACFPFPKRPNAAQQGLPYTQTSSEPKSCIFCHVSAENGFKVMWEDESFIAFHDYRPAAQQHLQIIPRSHIGEYAGTCPSGKESTEVSSASIKHLTKSNVALLKSMEAIGHDLLDELDVSPSMRRMGFHIPPFNSVDHLHLHVHGLPYKSFAKRAKYPAVRGHGSCQKGFSWFVEVGQAIRILENGGRVGVLPC
ncbi:Bifunctional adenosine 5'-phosphosulfate phosphorylase/adenylylsulfatase HINT4 [Hypsizygus marmoreus]|uniref:Bifunctional adenosine 5'-phosphosulfate phosphorylase/adenylylsulfatase HINT4 n=1 Tax=Hypsizygus marmoreus TaxID=39966 RepID=A0A369JU70_HYPMA|nr:Bifunctional adenosine 5'-phosphosulfate phosphorylase/adenylylsulfatase HINT4 [Hypsizygus marmoreus]